MRAKQVMSRLVHTVAAEASVYDAAQVLLNAGISAATVVDADGSMIGIVSEADLMYRTEIGTVPGKSWLQRLLADDAKMACDYVRSHSHRVADVMTKNVVTAEEATPLRDIAALMQRHRLKRIPILRDGKIVGVVSRANLLQGLLAREPSPSGDIAADEALRTAVAADWRAKAGRRACRPISLPRTAPSISGAMSTTVRYGTPIEPRRRTSAV